MHALVTLLTQADPIPDAFGEPLLIAAVAAAVTYAVRSVERRIARAESKEDACHTERATTHASLADLIAAVRELQEAQHIHDDPAHPPANNTRPPRS